MEGDVLGKTQSKTQDDSKHRRNKTNTATHTWLGQLRESQKQHVL